MGTPRGLPGVRRGLHATRRSWPSGGWGSSHSPRCTLGHLILDSEVFGQNLHPRALGRKNHEAWDLPLQSSGRKRMDVGGGQEGY